MDMNGALPSILPWDTSAGNRFSHFSPRDHSATLWIAAALSLTYGIGALLVQILIKWRVFGWDDGLLAGSTVVAFIQWMIIFGALSNGLGKISEHIPNLELTGSLAFASQVFFIVAHCLAKVSVLLLVRRLFAQNQSEMALPCDIAIGVTALVGFVSVLVTSIECPTSFFFYQQCNGQIARWGVATALDFITELLTMALPSYMVWRVQMKAETKIRVIFAFSSRLIVMALTATHFKLLVDYSNGLPSPFAIIPAFILQQTVLAASLITATIPNLKSFLQSLSGNWEQAGFGTGYTSDAYNNGTFEMSNVHSNVQSASRAESRGPHMNSSHVGLIGDSVPRQKTSKRGSLSSGGSQDMIIRKGSAWIMEQT